MSDGLCAATCRTCGKEPSYDCREHFVRDIEALRADRDEHSRLRESAENLLREEWWGNHGCPLAGRYGDDGEMQCAACITDFKREPMPSLEAHVKKMRHDAAVRTILQQQAQCAVCGKDIGPQVWCSLACMEKQIGPLTVEPKSR